MSKALIIGAGGVASVAVHKCCQNSDVFSEIMIASRTKSKCDALKAELEGKTATKISTAQVDAMDKEALCALIRDYQPDVVMNIALPYQDLAIMDACLECGVNYMDTANYEPEDTDDPEWRKIYEKRCKEAGFSAYKTGERNYAPAIELLRRAYDEAAAEGRAHVMVSARVYLGNCYCNQLDLENMEREYAAAARLARALGEKDLLRTIGYNAASTQIECGRFDEAYAFFSALERPDPLDLHKLAVCCEGLGLPEEALAALDRVPEDAGGLVLQLCDLVRYRLEHADYLRRPEYGEALLAAFARCREELPIGFAAFHLPWVLEWYTANRQYRAAFELERDFPLRLPTRSAAAVEYDGAKGVQ